MASKSPDSISKAFKRKSWNETRTNDSWAIFKIMSEFVEGYERLSRIGPCVSIFGSARLKEGDARYQDAQRIAEGLGKKGYGIISGGGPGIMEAANRGAADVPGGRSIGMGISLPFESGLNPYVTPELAFEYHYFFTRKLCMAFHMQALVVAPGGFGTCDEMFEMMTLKQTGKMQRTKIKCFV